MFWVTKFAKLGGSLKGAIKEFTKMNGRMPSSAEMNKMETIIKDAKSNVIPFPSKRITASKTTPKDPIDQRWASQEEWAAKRRAENKAAIERFEDKFGKPEDRASGGLAGQLHLNQGGRVGFQTGGDVDQEGVIPGFTKLKNPDGFPGNYNEFMYRGPDGQIYGAETYSSIAAGRYPDIYDPNKASTPVAEDKSLLEKWGEHAQTSQAMKGKTGLGTIPEYGMQTGYDFQKKFAGTDPRLSSYLAALWQLPQETIRGVGKTAYNLGSNLATGDATLKGTWQDWEKNLTDAWKTASTQTGQNIEGIMAAAPGGSGLTAEQQANRNKYLSSLGQKVETLQAKGIDPRMAGTYEQNIQLMADPRMRQASGGRVRFDNGGMSRRNFLKLMGGLASIPILGKYFKLAKPAAKTFKAVEASNATGMPAWFPKLVDKVLKEGKDMGGTVERQIVKQVELPKSKTKVTVEHDLNTGDTIVDVGLGKHGWTDGWNGQPVRLHLKKGEWMEPDMDLVTGKVKKKKGVKKRDEFDVEEAEFTGDAESVKYEESTFNKFGEHGSDFSEVEKYATGKVTKGSKPTKQVWEADWDDVIDTDYAKGGLAGVLKL